jgi:hypothetical protein
MFVDVVGVSIIASSWVRVSIADLPSYPSAVPGLNHTFVRGYLKALNHTQPDRSNRASPIQRKAHAAVPAPTISRRLLNLGSSLDRPCPARKDV